jgi:hypothetical protein
MIIYIHSFLSDVHIFLFFHQQYIHTSFYIFQQKKKEKKDFICIDDNDDDLYVLHLTATGEVQQWNALVDADNRWEIEAGGENERERRRERERERENESREWEELDICLIK